MAIVCPRCGRNYDVTLFQFGRAITCACGARVERDGPGRAVPRHGEPRFIADAMLGRLARWLRLLGYDTEYDPAVDDPELARRALRGGRILLTRDRGIPARYRLPDAILIEADRPLAQLRQVVDALGLDWRGRTPTRCTLCNQALVSIPREKAAGRIPPFVHAHHRTFFRCPRCRRIYWEGTHLAHMRERLEDALAGEWPGGAG